MKNIVVFSILVVLLFALLIGGILMLVGVIKGERLGTSILCVVVGAIGTIVFAYLLNDEIWLYQERQKKKLKEERRD